MVYWLNLAALAGGQRRKDCGLGGLHNGAAAGGSPGLCHAEGGAAPPHPLHPASTRTCVWPHWPRSGGWRRPIGPGIRSSILREEREQSHGEQSHRGGGSLKTHWYQALSPAWGRAACRCREGHAHRCPPAPHRPGLDPNPRVQAARGGREGCGGQRSPCRLHGRVGDR